MEDDRTRTIIMDNGTALSKVGYAGEDLPRIIIPTFPTGPIKAIPSKISQADEKKAFRTASEGVFRRGGYLKG